jgi:hypothetical protein
MAVQKAALEAGGQHLRRKSNRLRELLAVLGSPWEARMPFVVCRLDDDPSAQGLGVASMADLVRISQGIRLKSIKLRSNYPPDRRGPNVGHDRYLPH